MPITVTGIDNVQATLARVSQAAADPEMAHREAAAIVAHAVHAPVDTGRLQASITVYPGPGARVGSSLRYAPIQEARTRFLRRALERTMPQWLAAYESAISKATQ